MAKKKLKRKTLLMVSPNDISPNPHNPRLIFDPEDLMELKNSIEKVGILVPITIFSNMRKVPKTKYILLDGERRWRCAIDLRLPELPANVVDEPKDVTQNILFMFNIHHYRKEWYLFPTALKLEVLMKELKTDSETTLSNFTGVTRSMIRRCKSLLWLPNKYRNILMEKGSKVSTDFFIEVYPIAYRLSQEKEYFYPDGIQDFVDTCITKFLENIVVDVKEFRELRKCMAYYEDQQLFYEFKSRIRKFIKTKSMGLEIFVVPEIEYDRKRKNIIKYVSYLNENLKTINPNLISDVFFADQLKDLRKKLDFLIESVD